MMLKLGRRAGRHFVMLIEIFAFFDILIFSSAGKRGLEDKDLQGKWMI